MAKHLKIDQIWIDNRFRRRKRMTGGYLALDAATGFMTTKTSYGFTARKKLYFLKRFEVCSNIRQIARSLELHVNTIYDHLALDPKFRQEFIRLDEIEGKKKKLNAALEDVAKVEEREFVSEMLNKASKYKVLNG